MATSSDLSCLENTGIRFTNTAGDTVGTSDIVKLTPTVLAVAGDLQGVMTFESNYDDTGGTGDVVVDSLVILRNVHDPELAQDAATKFYVDSIAGAGVSWKTSAKLSSITGDDIGVPTAAVAAATTLDGIAISTLSIGDRVLLMHQDPVSENGIWEVTSVTAGGGSDLIFARPDDYPTGAESSGAAIFIEQGGLNADTAWVATDDTALVDTGDPIFSQFASTPSPAGLVGEIQFNGGSNNLLASSNFHWDNTGQTLTILSTATDTDAIVVTTGDLSLTEGNIFLDDATGLININSSALIMDTDSIIHNQAATFTLEKQGAGDLLIENSDTTAGSDILLKLGTTNLTTKQIILTSNNFISH